MRERVLIAGASGAIGQRLVPLLIGAGYQVAGTTRKQHGVELLRALGAEPILVDVYDAGGLKRAIGAANPEIVIHQVTGLDALRRGEIDAAIAENARVRTIGTRHLVEAAVSAHTRRMIAQSIAWVYAPGPLPHVEADALGSAERSGTVKGVRALEKAVLETPPLDGVILRYGQFYGPGTGRDQPNGDCPVHVDAAAYAALLAIDRASSGDIFNIAEENDTVSTQKARTALSWRDDFRLETPTLCDSGGQRKRL